MLLSFAVSVAAVARLVGFEPENRAIVQRVFTWITSGDFSVGLTLRLDPLSSVMILVITGIGSLIHVYSTAYMHEETDAEYARYFSYLNLFASFMLVLVLGANFLVMFVGWEGVGLCSYLLIGFWYQKKSASDAGKKAFIVNRIGDWGFILGVLLIFVRFGSLDFQDVARGCRRAQPGDDLRHACRSSRCCCSSAPPASPRRFRCTSGCRTRWKAPRRSPRSSMRRRW